mgnify:FL=1
MKKVTITSQNISSKQWNVLLLELNLMKRAWSKYAKIDIQAPGINKVIKWGTRRYDAKED